MKTRWVAGLLLALALSAGISNTEAAPFRGHGWHGGGHWHGGGY